MRASNSFQTFTRLRPRAPRLYSRHSLPSLSFVGCALLRIAKSVAPRFQVQRRPRVHKSPRGRLHVSVNLCVKRADSALGRPAPSSRPARGLLLLLPPLRWTVENAMPRAPSPRPPLRDACPAFPELRGARLPSAAGPHPLLCSPSASLACSLALSEPQSGGGVEDGPPRGPHPPRGSHRRRELTAGQGLPCEAKRPRGQCLPDRNGLKPRNRERHDEGIQ